MSQFWAELSRTLADSYLLPFDVTEYTSVIEKSIGIIKDEYESLIVEKGFSQALSMYTLCMTGIRSNRFLPFDDLNVEIRLDVTAYATVLFLFLFKVETRKRDRNSQTFSNYVH